ncbi:MAG: hypothetical protein NVS4B3_16720 [Gemmatimonadaceae bacterium]
MRARPERPQPEHPGVPELTRGLRAFGSLRGGAGEAQTRFFAPLLAARRAAERAADPAGQLRTFDAAALRATGTRWVREAAAARCPTNAAECRALAAHLRDEVEPLLARVALLDTLAMGARPGAASQGIIGWSAWTESLRCIFLEADACWLRVQPILDGWREEPRGWWRRALDRVRG